METSDLEFFIHGYKVVNLFGVEFQITTTHVCLSIIFCLLVVFALFANRAIRKADPSKAPKGFLNVVEILVEQIDNLLISTMGAELGPRFANYIGTLFILIVACNSAGLWGLHPPTADYGVTLPLALVTFFIIQYQGIKHKKWGKLKELFEPFFLFLPMNIIGEFATPMSMSLRLFGNILSGTILISLIYGLLPKLAVLVWPAAIHAYLDIFAGCLQAFVFCMLTMTFVKNATETEE